MFTQVEVALPSTEAEYNCITEAAKEAILFLNYLKELDWMDLVEAIIYNDSQQES